MIPDSGSRTNKTSKTSLGSNQGMLDNHHSGRASRAQKSVAGVIFRFSGWVVGFAGLFAMGGPPAPFAVNKVVLSGPQAPALSA